MLSPDGLTMAQHKIQAIQDWPEPHKVLDIMSFLRFANFYRCFIYGYSEITVLLMWPEKMSHGISPTTVENPSKN